jgi:hypothetical protein
MTRLFQFGRCLSMAALYFLAARGVTSYDIAAQCQPVQLVMLAATWFCTAMTGLFVLVSPLALAFKVDATRDEG